MKTGLKGLMLTTALVALTALPAFAQDNENPFLRGRYTAVTDRGQPEFDPEPIHVSTFDVLASVGLSAAYNDNIFATPNNEVSDTILRAQPDIVARSNWSNNELVAGASVDHKEYLDNGDESATDYDAFANGRLDVTRNFSIGLGGNAGHRTEERYAAASFATTDRASYDYTGAFVRGLYRVDRFQVEGTVGVTDDNFDQAIQKAIRDNTTTYVNGRVSYAISPDLAVFVQARRSELDYTDNTRDGTRTTVDAGVNFELAAPFRGEIAIGSFEENRDDPTLGKFDGLNIAANVQWFPTQLTTVTFSADRGVSDTGLLTAASAVNTAYGVRVDHELFRNVLLFARLRDETYDYQGVSIDRKDEALIGGLGAAWKLNKHMRLETEYTLRSQDSSGVNAGPSLDQNVISIGLRLFP
ncbi:MAG: outer membrane beta-barrel protein [Hyphomonadaceae bacterium]